MAGGGGESDCSVTRIAHGGPAPRVALLALLVLGLLRAGRRKAG
jgi:MYXO-CTERM domain-containing protein